MHIDRQTKDSLIEDASTGDEPLVVLKFQKRRMLWRLFLQCALGLPICLYLVISVAFEKKLFEFLFIEIFFGTLAICLLIVMVNMLMMKDIRLYKDRIVQHFRLSKNERTIYLNTARYRSITSVYHTLMVLFNEDSRWKRISFDSRLVGTKAKKKFYELLSELSGRSIAELKNTHRVKKLIKQEGDNGRQ